MVPAVVTFEGALGERRPPEFGSEYHERIVQHAALLQVRDQPGGRLVHGDARREQKTRDTEVMVPSVAPPS